MGTCLKGYSVLVTRPQDQAVGLCSAIEAEGGQAISAPMIAIRPVAQAKHSNATIGQLEQYDHVIFVSRNAVEFGLSFIEKSDQQLTHQQIYAVGVGTASSLKERGVGGVATPRTEFTSEGLLQLDSLQAPRIKDGNILIFRGVGGREHLAQTLEKRGATVNYCEVYERLVPDTCVKDTLSQAGVAEPDIAVITSLEGLTNFVDKIEDEGLDLLFDITLLVVGSRIAREVDKLGFTNPPVIVDNPNDDSIIDFLKRWVMDEI